MEKVNFVCVSDSEDTYFFDLNKVLYVQAGQYENMTFYINIYFDVREKDGSILLSYEDMKDYENALKLFRGKKSVLKS